MAQNQTMGNDPLDWIGKSSASDADSQGDGEALGSPSKNGLNDKNGKNGTNGTNGTNGVHAKHGNNGTPKANGTNGASSFKGLDGNDGHVSPEGSSSVVLPRAHDNAGLPVLSQNTNTALEREVLLFGDFRNDRRGGRVQNSNQILLVLIFVFTAVGLGLFFVNRTQQQHDDHVATLNSTVQTMKMHSAQMNNFLHTIIRSKDDALHARKQVIAEKERVIDNLVVIQGSSIRDMARELGAVLDFGAKTREAVWVALGLPALQKVVGEATRREGS